MNSSKTLRIVDFTFHPDAQFHGAYGDDEIYINAGRHECVEDIYQTIVHETIHFCLDKLDEDMTHDFKEERLIKVIQWAEEYLA